jgi:hypothetical protein
MTAKELLKRNIKSDNLRVLQTEDDQFFVESEKGKILYQVTFTDDETSCTCGDFAKNSRKDPNFRCKHIISVINSVPAGDVENGCFLEKKRPKLDERWIIEIEGNQFVKYAGLLDYAHQIGISSIEVEPLQLPTKDNGNFAICRATVVSKQGESYTDIGDANPTNCNAKVGKHLLRLASTRAIARALRSFTNVGLTALEELADLNDVLPNNSAKKTKPKTGKAAGNADKKVPKAKTDTKKKPPAKAKSEPKAKSKKPKEPEKSEPKVEAKEKSASTQPDMSEAQKRAIYNLSRRRGISVEELEQMCENAYSVSVEKLNSKDASSFIRNLQAA